MRAAAGYRPHIDGLRALAILPVVLFHAHVPGFSGGFVGVDIFFVISGYLITGILAREIDGGRFSFVGFYERRARRILPALTVMIVAVLAAAALLYLPGDFRSVPASALAATLFVANVLFFTQVGYFNTAAATEPLLHSWSLAIEEQFYIAFPILLILVARFAPRLRGVVIAGAAGISLAVAIAMAGDRTGFAFYLLPARGWELLVGALLALGLAPDVRSTALREAVAAAGLAAVACAVALFDHDTDFPGYAALLPVLGSAAILHAAPGTAVGRLLELKPAVAIGLISYSLYLWHWPLIVYTEYAFDTRLSGWGSIAVLFASLLAAVLSWRFVERPFRDPRVVGRRAIFVSAGVAMAAVGVASVAMVRLDGWPQRFPPMVSRMTDASHDVSPERARCHDSVIADRPPCTLGAPGVAPTALLWGDSHGVELAYALGEVAAAHGRALVQHTQSSCPPVPGYASSEAPVCARVNRDVLAAIRADPRLHTIYLAAFWSSSAYAGTAPALDRLIADLIADGRRVVLIGPVPPNAFDVPRHLARLARAGSPAGAEGARRRDFADAEARMGAVAARQRGPRLLYLDPADVLCTADRCALLAGGRPLYFDSHHLSLTGARTVVGRFAAFHPLPME